MTKTAKKPTKKPVEFYEWGLIDPVTRTVKEQTKKDLTGLPLALNWARAVADRNGYKLMVRHFSDSEWTDAPGEEEVNQIREARRRANIAAKKERQERIAKATPSIEALLTAEAERLQRHELNDIKAGYYLEVLKQAATCEAGSPDGPCSCRKWGSA